MKVLVFVAVLASAYARPGIVAPVAYTLPIAAPIAISSQFHAQDTLGQYNYGYSGPLSAKTEVRTFDGVTRGGYSYVDAEGKLQNVQYTSDAVNGFRVAASNLPVAPAPPKVEPLPQPTPVEDTPEVAEAKAKHLAALEEAKVRAAEPPAPEAAPVVTSNAVVAPVVSTYAYGISSPYTYAYPGITTYAAPYIASPYFVNTVPLVTQAKVEEAKPQN